MSASSSSTLVLSPAFGGPQAGSVVHEAKVFASAAFNYVVALIFVILPSIVFCYTISAVYNGNWWFVAGLTAFLAYYVPRSYGTPHHLNGEGNVWEGLRRSALYKYTAEQYIFGVHPHGIIPTFVTVSMMTQGCEWDKLFPGIARRGLAASSNFWVPLWRDIYLWLGYIDASAHVAQKALNKGYSLIVLPGGEQEMILAKPGDHSVVLQNRMGFVRLALQNGAWLVPVYAFGGNDTYHQVESAQGFLRWTARKFRVVMPIFYGRWRTPMPFKKPITVVVGKPIPVEKTPTPSDELVATVHAQYVSELQKLFDTHKAQFGAADATLNILDAHANRKKHQ